MKSEYDRKQYSARVIEGDLYLFAKVEALEEIVANNTAQDFTSIKGAMIAKMQQKDEDVDSPPSVDEAVNVDTESTPMVEVSSKDGGTTIEVNINGFLPDLKGAPRETYYDFIGGTYYEQQQGGIQENFTPKHTELKVQIGKISKEKCLQLQDFLDAVKADQNLGCSRSSI